VPGILAQSEADIERWIGMGIRFIAYQADCALLGRAARSVRLAFEAVQTPRARS
jgi:2-keto-3-deoxy-L-rhamnonate aldolase RhmA